MNVVRIVLAGCLFSYAHSAIECESNSTYLSVARADPVAVNAGTAVVVAGGYTGYDNDVLVPSDVMDIYRDDDGSGIIKVQNMTLPMARSSLTGVSIGDLIIFTGGLDEELQGSTDVYGFSLESGAWEVNTTFPVDADGDQEKRWGMGAAAASSTMAAAFGGGYEYDKDSGTYLASPDVFIMVMTGSSNNGNSYKWYKSQFTDAVPRAEVLAVAVDNYVFFAGGNTGRDEDGNPGTLLSTIEYVDLSKPNNGMKKLNVGLSIARQDLGGAAVITGNNKRHLVFAGGSILSGNGDGSFVEVRTIDIIDVTDISSPTIQQKSLQEARADLHAEAIDDLVFLGPGVALRGENRNAVNVLDVFNSTSENFNNFNLDEFGFDDGRSNYGFGAMYPDKVLIAGGLDDDEVTDLVDILDCITDDLPDGCDRGDYYCEEEVQENSYCMYWNEPPLCYGTDSECVCYTESPTPAPVVPTKAPSKNPTPAPNAPPTEPDDEEGDITAAAIGGAVGGAAVIIISAVLLYFCCIKAKRKNSGVSGDWMSQGQAPANEKSGLVGNDANQQSYQAADGGGYDQGYGARTGQY